MSEPTLKSATHAGRRRNPRLVALGLLLVAVGGLGAATLYNTIHEHRPAVVMARDVLRGQHIQPEDLKVAEAPPGMTEYIPSAELDSLIGQTARFDLPAEAFPAHRLLGTPAVSEGSAVIGLALGPGRLPNSELVPGQSVQLVNLTDGSVVVTAMVMTAPRPLEDGSAQVLDVVLPSDQAAGVALLSAQEQLALYLVEG